MWFVLQLVYRCDAGTYDTVIFGDDDLEAETRTYMLSVSFSDSGIPFNIKPLMVRRQCLCSG